MRYRRVPAVLALYFQALCGLGSDELCSFERLRQLRITFLKFTHGKMTDNYIFQPWAIFFASCED